MNRKIATVACALSLILGLPGCSKAPGLDAKTLDSDAPDKVASEAFKSVIAARGKHQSTTAFIASLPKQWRIVYTTTWLDDEVINGGFHQFFWNTGGEWNRETEEDLATIGAEPYLQLFRDAKKTFDKYDYAAEKEKSSDSHEAFKKGYDEKRMDTQDDAYYKEKKSLPSFLGDYIKRNRALYEQK